MQQQAEEEELGLSSAALAALKEFALENNLLDLDGDSEATDVRLQVQDHMDVKERAHDFCFTFEDEDGPDEQVSIALTGVNPELGQTLASTGLTVWRAAEEMARFMWEHRRWFAGKRVVELGAGLGLCGVLASKLCVGGTVVITDGGEEFTDDAMEALRRNLQKNACNLSQDDETKAESGGGKAGSPRDPRRSHGKGAAAGHSGSGNDEDNYDDDANGDGDDNGDCDGNDDDDDDDDDGDGVLGGGRVGGEARGAKVVLERLTWGDHTDFLERNADGGGSGGGGGGGGGFDFIVAADVIYEEAAVSPLLHTVVDILRLRRTADSVTPPPPPPPPSQSASSCPPPPSVSTFLLAFARRNISIDRVLDEAESLGLRWRVPDGFTPTSSSENIYLMCLA